MFKLLQSLFGKKSVEVQPQAPVGVPSFNTEYVEALEKKGPEFHEEIRAQVDAEKSATKKTAAKPKSNKGKKAPAKPAEKKPAKKSAKSKKQ